MERSRAGPPACCDLCGLAVTWYVVFSLPYIYIFIYIYMCVCVCVCVCTYMYACVCVTCTCIYIYIYIRMYIYIYIFNMHVCTCMDNITHMYMHAVLWFVHHVFQFCVCLFIPFYVFLRSLPYLTSFTLCQQKRPAI